MSHNTRPLNRQDYKTLTLAALGGALEFYDFIIFVFFAAVGRERKGFVILSIQRSGVM